MYEEVMKRGRNFANKKGGAASDTAADDINPSSTTKPVIDELDEDDPIAERRRIFGEDSQQSDGE